MKMKTLRKKLKEKNGSSGKKTKRQARMEQLRSVKVSRHAQQRILQRCNMKPASLSTLLERDICLNVGTDNEDKVHFLLYDPTQLRHCVAICHILPRKGKEPECYYVVTVLPLIYHELLSWPVTEEQLEECKEKVKDLITA